MSSSTASTAPKTGKALVQEKFNQFMNYGPVKSFFDKAEEKTGKNRMTLLQWGLVPLVLVFGNTVVTLLASLLATLYPTYSCLQAIVNKNEEGQRRWVEYWIVMSLLYVLDIIFSPALSTFVPLFWLVRLCLLVWCIAPSSRNGSNVIFGKVVYPLFVKYGKHIDDNVVKARELFSVGATEVTELVAEVTGVVADAVEEVGDVLDEAVDSSKLLEDVAEIGNKFVEASKTKLTEGFGNLTDAAA